MPAIKARDEEPVPSVFDEDEDSLQEQRQRELRRIRSVLISSGFLILLPDLISRIRSGGLGSLSDTVFAGYGLGVLAVFIALGILAMKQPLAALIAGIAVYAALQAWIIWRSPATLYTGWIYRVLVLLNLCMPLGRAGRI